MDEEVFGEAVQGRGVVAEDFRGGFVGGLNQFAHLVLHGGGGLGRAVGTQLAVEVGIDDRVEGHHADGVVHAEAGDHVARNGGGALDVVGGAGGAGVEHQLLGGAASHEHLKLLDEILFLHQHALLLVGLHGEAQRAGGAGNDGDLANRYGVFLARGDQGVADLVVGDDALFLGGDDHALLFAAGDDVFGGAVEVSLADGGAVVAHSGEGGLVQDVGQLCAGRAGRGVGHALEVDVGLHGFLSGVHLEDFLAALEVGQLHRDAAVEAAGSQQRLVEDLGAVGGAEDDDALFGIEAVHLGQQLVERLFALVVAAEAGAVALFADGVDFVDEHDAGGLLAGLLEQVAHAGRAGADEHFHERRAGHEEERASGLTRDRLRQQGFAGAGRANQQRALGDFRADGGIAAGVFQDVDDFDQRFLGLVLTGHVAEAHLAGLHVVLLGAGLAEVEHAEAAATALAVFGLAAAANDHDDVVEHESQHRQRQQRHDDLGDGDGLGGRDGAEGHVGGPQLVHQIVVIDDLCGVIDGLILFTGLFRHDLQRIAADLHRIDLSGVEHFQKFGIADLLHDASAGRGKQLNQPQQQHEDQQKDPG